MLPPKAFRCPLRSSRPHSATKLNSLPSTQTKVNFHLIEGPLKFRLLLHSLFFASASFIPSFPFCLCFLFLAEPLAVPPPITHQFKKRQKERKFMNCAAPPINSINCFRKRKQLIGLLICGWAGCSPRQTIQRNFISFVCLGAAQLVNSLFFHQLAH